MYCRLMTLIIMHVNPAGTYGLDLDIRFIEVSQARLPSSILLCSQHSCTI